MKRILVFEDNLMWSARLAKSLKGHGYDAEVRRDPPGENEEADAAIINLGWTRPGPEELVAKLHANGIPVIAHAGHREKELIALGKAAGADLLATNSELTYKLPELLLQVLRVESPKGS